MYSCIHACLYIYMYFMYLRRPIIHGVSIKTKPNCLCHIYLMPDHIILNLARYLEN